MLTFKDLSINGSYDSEEDDIISSFYVPVLSVTKEYNRIAGFFTSSSLAITARGLLQMNENGGHMRLLVSPRLSSDDVFVINDSMQNPEKYINDEMVKTINESCDDQILMDYKKLLGYLIANNCVQIKVVLVKNKDRFLSGDEIDESAIFHQKVGILQDYEGNTISFSGSINETFSAWSENVEEFKTFKLWDDGQKTYCLSDIRKFDEFWNGSRENIIVYDLPDAVKNEFIEYTKNTKYTDLVNAIKKHEEKFKKKNIFNSLFWYQKEAVEKWKNNDRRLLFAMATGTGKTRTAIACMADQISRERTLVIVSTPQSTLSKQWMTEIKDLKISFDKDLICDSTSNYKVKMEQYLLELSLELHNSICLFTTHATASSDDFINAIKTSINKKTVKVLFVGDEVHGLGSPKQRKALDEFYDYRIGLSATPSRWFDDEGSEILKGYFGNDMYEFGIEKALVEINPLTNQTFLTPYYYYPKSMYLTDDEDSKYEYYTSKISRLRSNDDDKEIQEIRNRLLEKRADILKNAEGKIDLFDSIITELMEKGRIENTIVFTSPELIKPVLEVLCQHNIVCAPFTQKQGTTPKDEYGGISERQFIIKQFKEKTIQVIVAIKCMDEGIDIPSADTAILVSSTTNPREYIQRIGRVIRRYPGKKSADIYDLVVKSHNKEINDSIKKTEMKRELYIADLAKNAVSAIIEMHIRRAKK